MTDKELQDHLGKLAYYMSFKNHYKTHAFVFPRSKGAGLVCVIPDIFGYVAQKIVA